MGFRGRLAWFVALSVGLAGCGGGGVSQSSSAIDFRAGLTGKAPSGIYAASEPDQCCWMAKRAVFTLTRSPDASTFEFSFFSPKVPASLGPEAFTFTIDGERVRRCCYGAGLHVLDIPLPVASAGSSGSSGATTITVDAKYAFVPAKYGMNGDVRALSVMVKRVAIQ